MTDWCILRTSGRHTLRLAASLSADGYEAWAPYETQVVKVPKMNAKREVQLPLMAGFVFAKADRLVELLDMANLPMRRGSGLRQPAHAEFSVFHFMDRIPLIEDSALNPLRRIARKRSVRPKAVALKKNQIVRVDDMTSCFHGLTGVVKQSSERESAVCFDGKWNVKISTFILKPVALECQMTAARKAA